MMEERSKGNFAIIKFDKLIVKKVLPQKTTQRHKIKPSSPLSQIHKQTNSSNKVNRKNAFDVMRERSSTLSSLTLIMTRDKNTA
ncbi:unnamed protein product [Leptidea sinapis]|uniref:Uncharacterized protein n=1 Tax=Leptidea sinapis TaxID=189913 RepID=A0A5E4QYR7_9NEOP|nr:unnamed protein product [Leptidea sinapis]